MVVIGLVALLVALVATPASAKVAASTGLLDRPGALKVQDQPVPYLGGLAIFTASAVGVLVGSPALALPGALALGLGTADDAVDLPAWVRLLCEIGIGVAAAAVVPLSGGAVGWVGTVVLVVVVINAVNMVDGLDGLAGGVALMSVVGFALLLSGDAQRLAVALVGGLVGFLWYNRPPARIYLGDGGSYLLGAWLAVLAAAAWRSHHAFHDGAPALLFLAVPLVELLVAIVRRARGGQHLFAGDRDHIYDQLVARGWSVPRVILACIAAQGALVVVGLTVARLFDSGAVTTAVSATTLLGVLLAIGTAGFLAPAPAKGMS